MAISAGLRNIVLERDNFTCQMCNQVDYTGKELHIDHKHSLFNGGSNSLNNLWVLCIRCNRKKGRASMPGAEIHQNKVREYRLKRGLTKKQLAKAASICLGTVNRVEASGKVCGFALTRISKVLGIPHAELEDLHFIYPNSWQK